MYIYIMYVRMYICMYTLDWENSNTKKVRLIPSKHEINHARDKVKQNEGVPNVMSMLILKRNEGIYIYISKIQASFVTSL